MSFQPVSDVVSHASVRMTCPPPFLVLFVSVYSTSMLEYMYTCAVYIVYGCNVYMIKGYNAEESVGMAATFHTLTQHLNLDQIDIDSEIL